jgi:hypothetical protein
MIFMSYLLSLSVGLDGKILVFDHLCVFSTLCVALLDCIHLPGGTIGYPADPRLIHLSVCLSVRSLFIILQKIAQAQQIW